MKPKTMMLLVVAVGCGLVASYMTSRLLAERNAAPPVPMVKVLVAIKKVPQFTTLKKPEEFFAEKEMQEGSFPKKSITSFEELKNQRTVKTVKEEDFITKDDLVNKENTGIEYSLAPGQRAVAIKVNPESLVGGFVTPGAYVDVMNTVKRSDADSEAKILLQNMKVLAVDQKDNKDLETRTILGQTITLAATVEEAQQLSLAAALGELRLVLRPAGDNQMVRTRPSRIGDLGRQQKSGNAGYEGGGDGLTSGDNPVPNLPTLPRVEPVAPEPEPVVKEEVKEEPAEVHKMTITSGEYTTTAHFVKDKKGGWNSSGGVVRTQPTDSGVKAEAGAVPPPPVVAKPEKSEKAEKAPESGGEKSGRNTSRVPSTRTGGSRN